MGMPLACPIPACAWGPWHSAGAKEESLGGTAEPDPLPSAPTAQAGASTGSQAARSHEGEAVGQPNVLLAACGFGVASCWEPSLTYTDGMCRGMGI